MIAANAMSADITKMAMDDGGMHEVTTVGGCKLWLSAKDGKVMTMAYWSLPETALDDPDEAVGWARQSIDAALRKAAVRKPRKPKP